MEIQLILAICAAAISVISLILTIVILTKLSKSRGDSSDILRTMTEELKQSQREMAKMTSDATVTTIGAVFERQDKRLDALTAGVGDSLQAISKRFVDYSMQTEQKLGEMRATIERQLKALQEDNNQKLEKMRETVDEKLQKTLETKITESFKFVSERLEQVYKGLGEMQTLAVGVGDLKRVLTNVKTRGTLGEIQLEAILEQIMPAEQYDKQVATKAGTLERVDFAIKLPGDDGSVVYLPIDAKFPMDAYEALNTAYDTGDAAIVESAAQGLAARMRTFAKDIHDKYINPPDTTDFAILFLPVEGLYAEVVRRGIMDDIQRRYKVTVVGPTNMAAYLNSLQMGFRTLAIQRRSGEVWKVLGAVKTEFEKFGDVLTHAQQRIGQVNEDLDALIGTRTRMINSKLRQLSKLPTGEEEPINLLED